MQDIDTSQKEEKGLISIIVPVFNAEKYLEECIESILKQTYSKYELILVDDGSTDHSLEIMNRYEERSKKIICVSKKNGGPNSARKEGLEVATGEYTMFVDADDYVDKMICERLIRIIDAEQVDIVLSKPIKVLKNTKMDITGKWKQGKYSANYIAENIINTETFIIVNISMGLCANLYKTKIIRNIFRNIDLRIDFSEDYACFLLALLDSENIFLLDEYLYGYRQNMNSATHQHSKSNFESQKYLYRFLISELKRRKVGIKIYKQLEWMIIRDLLLGGYDAFSGKSYLYPFREVKRESNIVIYGAGIYGGELYNFVNQTRICNIVMWVDQQWEKYQEAGLPVFGIDDIKKVDYDYIVLAILKIDVASKIKTDLEKLGIMSDKIVLIDQGLISYEELPDSFWGEGE